MQVELVPVDYLRPHEETISDKVDELEKVTKRWKAYVLPLVVDRDTCTILDGHHRHQVAIRLGLSCLPCVLVNYLGDESIELDVWPNCGRDSITKQEVLSHGESGTLMPPKTSRHRLPDYLPPIAIPLSRILEPAEWGTII
ncbi:MAG: ParB N-terminal domain-containing protein [Candidatus Thermoplasmatota archaeon]|nr:ParB N-terminal domain-containing protein [Candidatus Thermoplasmatota archaeon]